MKLRLSAYWVMLALAAHEVLAAEEPIQLEELTVNARRSEERVKNLPFTVNVLSGDKAEVRRINSLEDITASTPGIDVNSWGSSREANVRIRGVGALYQTGEDDTSVVVNVDGVSSPSTRTRAGMLDIEQIEVLKGPQGTLFGRSSEAGAINIRTRRPTREFEAYVRGEMGSDHQYLLEGVLNGALSDTVAARFAARQMANDVQYYNGLTGKPFSKPEDLTWRASLLWQPAVGTEMIVRASHDIARKYQAQMLVLPYGSPPKIRSGLGDLVQKNRDKVEDYSINFQHDMSWGRLNASTSHTRNHMVQNNVVGRDENNRWLGTEIDDLNQRQGGYKAFEHEIRLGSLPSSSLFWVAGVNVFRNDRDRNTYLMGRGTRSILNFATQSDAIFGETTLPMLADRLRLTLGLRHSHERKSIDGTYFVGRDMPPLMGARELSERHTTGRVGLSWAWNAESSVYAMWARGSKAGGFSDYPYTPADTEPYRRGRVETIEIGMKHEAADGRLRVNGAIFANRVTDDHLLTFNPETLAAGTVNVDTKNHGVELEASWRATKNLTLSGGFTWLEGEIKNELATPSGWVRKGNRVPDVPSFSGLLAVEYRRSLPSFLGLSAPRLHTNLSWRYVGERANDPENHQNLARYQKVNARIGLANRNTEIYVYGHNLTDERHDLYTYFMGPDFYVGLPSQGRRVGLGVSHYF